MSTTITSLLNSLHSHLQSQTHLLPTLHAQLGLPPTALADELSTLQQQLTQCVESQIDLRRKQVDEWVSKCDDIEAQCISYRKALGGHAKATGSSVGEIRKEHVLPRRFEMITEYQEKLRQLYHTKLEQLLTLSNRIAVLSRTLGPDFYSPDVFEPVHISAESESDPDAYRDVTPERFSKLEKELVRGKGEVAKRTSQLSATMVQIDWLYSELGMSPPSIDDFPSASSSTLNVPPIARSSSACGNHTMTSDPFLSSSVAFSTPTPEARGRPTPPFLFGAQSDESSPSPESDYQRIFARFVARLEELSDEELSSPTGSVVGLEGVDPTPGLIAWAEATRASLEDLKRRRETHIQAMYDQLEALWRRLGVSDAEMDAFVESQRGSTEETVRAYEEELERMMELKRERMSVFVENARAEISKLWDDLMVGEEERADFAPFADDEHTEELLAIHEEEIRHLKEERRLKGPLLKSIKKYFDICEDEKELAAAATDQSRLLGRGPRDPGRLLREEKMRKRVTKEKPRLEQDLLVSIPAWEAETGRQFLVHGDSILRILSATASAVEKENNSNNKRGKPSGRAGSVPPRVKTPSNPINHYVPGSSQGGAGKSTHAVTPAVRPSSSMAMSRSVPAKRPRVNSNAAYSNVPMPLGTHRGSAVNRAPSPTKIPSKTSLPRPVPIAMPVPKSGTQHHVLGHGRLPSAQQQPHRHAYHPYPQSQRAASHSSASSTITVYGSAALNSSTSSGASRKASRARRESFKPRPSIDDDAWAGAGLGTSDRRWAGFPGGAVREEDEDF